VTPIVWNENTEAVPAGWISRVRLWLVRQSPSSSRLGDVPPRRKHEKNMSHADGHEADRELHVFTQGWGVWVGGGGCKKPCMTPERLFGEARFYIGVSSAAVVRLIH